MTKLNVEFFNSHNPCYPAQDALGEGWEGTILDVLENKNIPADDRLWAATREGVLSDKTLRLAAVEFVRKTPISDGKTVFDLLTDERSKNALLIAERHAKGQATDEELNTARAAAMAAARDAWGVLRYAAWAAVWATWETYSGAVSAVAYTAVDVQVGILIEIIKENE